MNSFTFKYSIFICVFGLIISGCSEPQAPSQKQARLITAENMELQKEIELRDILIEELKAQHKKELEEKEKLLAESQKEVEKWKQNAQENVRDQVQDVLDTVIEENVRLRREIQELKKQTTNTNNPN